MSGCFLRYILPLQPGTMIICNKLPFAVSNNGKIYNFTGGSFKLLYITDPSEHKFLASLSNSPCTFSSLLNSALKLFGFSNNQHSLIPTKYSQS